MTVTLHCKVCDVTFEGELVAGTGYGEACKNGCGRYTQRVVKQSAPKQKSDVESFARAKKAAVKRRRKTS